MPKVNPEILSWARETAGFSYETAAKKLGFKDSKEITAAEKLKSLEEGNNVPSRPTLVKMAKQYRRPLLTFYMSEPPRRGDRGQDFRTLPPDQSKSEEALLDALVRNIKARQGIIRSIIEDEEDATPITFVGCSNTTEGVDAIVSSIKEAIKLDLNEYIEKPSPSKAFSYLRNLVEEIGVFVLLIGNLGSHHTVIDVSTFRGLVLSDDFAPFIVINDQDSHAAWSFTLLHELAHLWLGQSGVSGINTERAIEQFCNDVAGEILLPAEQLGEFSASLNNDTDTIISLVTEFATNRNLSSSMVAYRLYRTHTIDKTTWQYLNRLYRKSWLDNRKAAKGNSKSGPSYYTVRKHRLGSTLIDFVGEMMAAGVVTTTKAGKILGVKPGNVYPLIDSTRTL